MQVSSGTWEEHEEGDGIRVCNEAESAPHCSLLLCKVFVGVSGEEHSSLLSCLQSDTETSMHEFP